MTAAEQLLTNSWYSRIKIQVTKRLLSNNVIKFRKYNNKTTTTTTVLQPNFITRKPS